MHHNLKGHVLRVHCSQNKRLAIFYQLKLKTNKSALQRIKIYEIALGLGIYLQIARHRLCGPDVSGICHYDLRANGSCPVTSACLHSRRN